MLNYMRIFQAEIKRYFATEWSHLGNNLSWFLYLFFMFGAVILVLNGISGGNLSSGMQLSVMVGWVVWMVASSGMEKIAIDYFGGGRDRDPGTNLSHPDPPGDDLIRAQFSLSSRNWAERAHSRTGVAFLHSLAAVLSSHFDRLVLYKPNWCLRIRFSSSWIGLGAKAGQCADQPDLQLAALLYWSLRWPGEIRRTI